MNSLAWIQRWISSTWILPIWFHNIPHDHESEFILWIHINFMTMNSHATFHDLWIQIWIHLYEEYSEIIHEIMCTKVPDEYIYNTWKLIDCLLTLLNNSEKLKSFVVYCISQPACVRFSYWIQKSILDHVQFLEVHFMPFRSLTKHPDGKATAWLSAKAKNDEN